METVAQGICFLFLLGAVWQDITTRKIKNWYNMTGVFVGIVLGIFGGVHGVKEAFLGFGIAFLIGIAGYVLGLFRAGDAKFLWGIGAMKGWFHFLNSFVLGILAGGMIAFVILLIKKDGKKRIKHMGTYLKFLWLNRSYTPYVSENQREFPFSVPIALGAVLDVFILIL